MYKEITQEEAEGLWSTGVRDISYKLDSDLYYEGARVPWVPFVPRQYLWESPSQHWAETWRVETE